MEGHELSSIDHHLICQILYPQLNTLDFGQAVNEDAIKRALDVWFHQGFIFSEEVPFGIFQKQNGFFF